MMKIIKVCVGSLLISSFFLSPVGLMSYTDNTTDDNNNQDQNQNTNSSNQSSGSSSGLTNEINRKTQKALKTFKNLLSKNKSKKNFFADQGETPTSSELGGATFGEDDTPQQTQFHIPDLDKGRKF